MRIRARAKKDILDAAIWYESRRMDLGVQFVLEVDAAIAGIAENPLQFPVYEEPATFAVIRTPGKRSSSVA